MVYKENGFTLVELAISLVVIGLLIGGVLKGQELVENSRVNSVIRDIHAMDAATIQFYERFDALPGDFNNPSIIPGCTGTCATAGSNDGIIHVTGSEATNFFWHMEHMGYIQMKRTDGFNQPVNAWGGAYHPMHWNSFNLTKRERARLGNYLTIGDSRTIWDGGQSYHMRVTRTSVLDQKLDDGKPLTGSVQVDLRTSSQAACYDATTLDYVPDKTIKICNPFVYLTGANP